MPTSAELAREASGTRLERIVIVNTRAEAPPRRPDTMVAVLDTSWTPAPGERDDLVAVRPLVARIVAERDLFDDSLDVLDDWAARTGMVERFTVRGVGWWSHARGFLRLTMHELLLWRHLLDMLVPPGWQGPISIPGDRRLLVEAARAGENGGTRVDVRGSPLAGTRIVRRGWRYAVRRTRRLWYQVYPPRRAIIGRRRRMLAGRIERAREAPLRILAPMREASFHVIRTERGIHRGDPYVGPVLARLVDEGATAIRPILGLDLFRDADWARVRDDDEAIPWVYVADRWPARTGVTPPHRELAARLDAIPNEPLLVNGTDLGPFVRRHVRKQAGWLRLQAVAMEMIEGLLTELQPSVLLTGWEAARTSWLGAAGRNGVPIVAVQHGVIYPRTPDYVRPADPAHPAADLTCLFGPYERDLLVRDGGYAPEAVLATGSPRTGSTDVMEPAVADERATVRRQIGVADGDRLLVVSTARHSVGDAFHSMAMVGRLLAGPLPGVHVVFKLHPEETEGGHYPTLVAGLAVAGGYEAPRTSVIRDVDVYALLRAADAHLGQYSTVLTDAVLTSTPNMIAIGQASADIIGYVDAGVAVAVASVDDIRAFMADPRPPAPEAREAFLRAHSIEGDAVGRIAAAVRDVAAGAAGSQEVA